MKRVTLALIAFLFFSAHTHAQHNPEILSFKKMAKQKSIELHADYPKVSKANFKCCDTPKERHEKVDKAWHDLWHNFTQYYHEKGLVLDKKMKVFVHLHFSETGHLDFFGYRFKGKETETAKRFVMLFKEYIKDHDFEISEGVKFSQCGELHLLPRIGDQEDGVKEGM